MRLERMLGYLPALFQPAPKSVLIVGFGAGVTAGTFTTFPTIQRIVICEMEPIIPPTTTKWFATQNHNVVKDKRTQVVFDDARHFVLTTKEKFDVITSDPIHPFVKGSASLYSKEYFQMLRDHLNPGGVVTQWIPLYESDFATVKSEIATFFEVFPYASVWGNTSEGGGYDLVLIGHERPMTMDLPDAQARLDSPPYAAMKADLTEVGFTDVRAMYDTYAGDKQGLRDWTKGAAINRDRDLRLQYLAGLSLNRNLGDPIYKEILGYKTALPTGLTVIYAKP
jgi:spermidine synthase